MDEDHPAEQKKSRWWPTSRGAMRIFAALIVVGALLFTGVGALLFLISVSAVATLDNEILLVLGVATVVAAVVVLIRVGQHYQWTGFGESVQPKLDNQEIQPRKTLWDWLQLFIVPLALAAIGLWFSAQQDARQLRLEEQRAQNAALQAYLDQMSQLMLEGDLLSSEEDSEVRTLARARTQTVLGQLDSDRKASVVQFLYEASLIKKEDPVLNLSNVGLRGANLSQLDLSDANLSGAVLRRADLHGTNLSDAILSGAELNNADLRDANMSGANLSSAYLNFANLSGAVVLNNANLIDAKLPGTNMSGAFLRNADLREAQLIETDLSGADLSGADLSGAILSDPDLHNANLIDAKGVTEEQLEDQAKTLKGATMPGGSIHR
jgi:uncharacterized protein YjbI with pentapeptide repeats